MKILIVTEQENDLTAVLKSCGEECHLISLKETLSVDLTKYDAYCILEPGKLLDARVRVCLETENAKGKRVFTEAIRSYLDIYSQNSVNTVHSRLIYLEPEQGTGITGLKTGDLLDDQSNVSYRVYSGLQYEITNIVPLLVYRYHINAHDHTEMTREEILKDAVPGMWTYQNNTVLMTSFTLHNFNKARFAPKDTWRNLIVYVAKWLTGKTPSFMPENTVKHLTEQNLSNPDQFEKYRKNAIHKGLRWLEVFLVDNGHGGIQEGMHHQIDPEGNQALADIGIRADCTGESAGAFKMNAYLEERDDYAKIGYALDDFVYGPMMVKGGICDGMIRWTTENWGRCFHDDVARAVMPVLYECVFLGRDKYFPLVCRALDFLVKTTDKNGLRIFVTEEIDMTEESIRNIKPGTPSIHYNAYYHAALLLAYKYSKNPIYLEIGKRGLETLMEAYPDTVREHSETQEICRFILPLAVLYDVTREERYKEMLYRITNDLEKYRHPFGGYQEWDTGYKALCSRESKGECSILTENGDPVADQLYSVNWLPVAFAYAYYATGDEWFHTLWHNIVEYCIRTQIISNDVHIDGGWSRAFDMNRKEIYAAPHDTGWAANACETGWGCAEIIMGMMMPDVIAKADVSPVKSS